MQHQYVLFVEDTLTKMAAFVIFTVKFIKMEIQYIMYIIIGLVQIGMMIKRFELTNTDIINFTIRKTTTSFYLKIKS